MPRTSERRNTLRRVRKMESLVARFLEDNRAVCGYGTEDFLAMTHAILSAIVNSQTAGETVAQAIHRTSAETYGQPIRLEHAEDLARGIVAALKDAQL